MASKLKHLIGEIHRRSIWQVVTIYVVGASVGYQLEAYSEGVEH